MSIALIYWILILLWLVMGISGGAPWTWATFKTFVPNLLLWILLALLGWQVFGAAIHK